MMKVKINYPTLVNIDDTKTAYFVCNERDNSYLCMGAVNRYGQRHIVLKYNQPSNALRFETVSDAMEAIETYNDSHAKKYDFTILKVSIHETIAIDVLQQYYTTTFKEVN